MKLIEKILLATDFGPSAEIALREAVRVAKIFNSGILLTHIMPDLGDDNLHQEKIREFVDNRLNEWAEKIRKENIAVETAVEAGIPFVNIMRLAELKDVNVIMIGSGNSEKGGPGTTAEKLMYKSVKPVWVINKEGDAGVKRILCPVDFSEASDRALNNAIHLARHFDSELIILHVRDSALSPYLRLIGMLKFDSEQNHKSRETRFENHLKNFDLTNIKWQKVMVTGAPSAEIIQQAQTLKADLILMGSVGHDAHPRVLAGATARVVFRALPGPVIVFKSENIIQLKLEVELADINARYRQGIQLLENGFTREAMAHFTYCLNEDPLYAPAWEKLAEAHIRSGDTKKAEEYQLRAKEIRDKLWAQRVESEVKRRHALFKSES
jgi:nucleotide-binding universal stress UspA family protein